jgi:hypothetical protein
MGTESEFVPDVAMMPADASSTDGGTVGDVIAELMGFDTVAELPAPIPDPPRRLAALGGTDEFSTARDVPIQTRR